MEIKKPRSAKGISYDHAIHHENEFGEQTSISDAAKSKASNPCTLGAVTDPTGTAPPGYFAGGDVSWKQSLSTLDSLWQSAGDASGLGFNRGGRATSPPPNNPPTCADLSGSYPIRLLERGLRTATATPARYPPMSGNPRAVITDINKADTAYGIGSSRIRRAARFA